MTSNEYIDILSHTINNKIIDDSNTGSVSASGEIIKQSTEPLNNSESTKQSIITPNDDVIYERLFPVYEDRSILKKLRIDKESIHYITTPINAKKITTIITSYIGKPAKECVIVDATSGVGGDTIAFCRKFGSVISIELDSNRHQILKNNVEAYKFNNVTLINGNCLDVLPKLIDIDIVYIDPPWGGESYKNNDVLRITMGEILLEDIILNLFDSTKMICVPKLLILKIPKNYDIEFLYNKLNPKSENTDEVNKYKIYLHSLLKMNILVVEL